MITHFYKILYDNKDVVYVGVTTRTIQYRFKQHIKSKHLNNHYSVIEFDKIVHPNIKSLDDYYEEYKKVSYLEKKYIQKEKDNGSNLLNISTGGEWGSLILNKLLKENFFKKYGSYNGYEEYKKRIDKFERWILNWILVRTNNKTRIWIKHWIEHKSENKTKSWIRHWIEHKSTSKTKIWIRSWIYGNSENKTKRWIKNWINHKSENKTKRWIRNWILVKKEK